MASAAASAAAAPPLDAPLPPLSPNSPLLALPDHLLRRLLRPLHPSPDLFAVARTCRRLRGVLAGPASYLVVVAPAPPSTADRPPLPPRSSAFPSLASAVAASRPGDTIWLSPTHSGGVGGGGGGGEGEGEGPGHKHHHHHRPPHRVDAAVRVRHPLNIVGGGERPSDTRVECASSSAPAVLDFSASRARLANVTLVHRGGGGCGGAAVLHRSGRLRVERCRLKGARHGVPELSAPLVTVAAVDDDDEEEEERGARTTTTAAGRPRSGGGGSLLEVSETELAAAGRRGSGVRALGTGEVAAVRAVFGGGGGGGGSLYWLEVDSSQPGGKRAPGAAAAAASLLAVGRAPAPAQLPPHPLAPKAWRGHGPDDPLLRINALLGGKRGRRGGGGGEAQEEQQQQQQQQQRQRCF